MKHHIVIYQGGQIVENMMSKIATPKELRARLAKRFPGKHKLYFRTINSQYGWFSNGHGIYHWFIDLDSTARRKKPNPIPETRLIRDPHFCINGTQSPYDLYEGDVLTVPPFDDTICMCQNVTGLECARNDIQIYYIRVKLNRKMSWLHLTELQKLDNSASVQDALEKFAGKTVRITSAMAFKKTPKPFKRGLLTGKPLNWFLFATECNQKEFKYEIL